MDHYHVPQMHTAQQQDLIYMYSLPYTCANYMSIVLYMWSGSLDKNQAPNCTDQVQNVCM